MPYSRSVQPAQCVPKRYDHDLVDRAHILYYDAGRTQTEVARALGVTQKVIYGLMRNHGFVARAAAPRDQRGEKNNAWKGVVGYAAQHKRVEAARGPAKDAACRCGAQAVDWANLTGRYEDINDYERMCRSCHRAYDGRQRDEKGRYI